MEFEKTLKINRYISNKRITYLSIIPITYPTEFDYFHLFFEPAYNGDLFKNLIPKVKYLLSGTSDVSK